MIANARANGTPRILPDSFLKGVGLDQRRFVSAPRAVASVTPGASIFEKPRSLPLAVLTQTENRILTGRLLLLFCRLRFSKFGEYFVLTDGIVRGDFKQ